jgi:hypothetical protein
VRDEVGLDVGGVAARGAGADLLAGGAGSFGLALFGEPEFEPFTDGDDFNRLVLVVLLEALPQRVERLVDVVATIGALVSKDSALIMLAG